MRLMLQLGMLKRETLVELMERLGPVQEEVGKTSPSSPLGHSLWVAHTRSPLTIEDTTLTSLMLFLFLISWDLVAPPCDHLSGFLIFG